MPEGLLAQLLGGGQSNLGFGQAQAPQIPQQQQQQQMPLDLNSLIFLLAGAGLPVLSRAIKPGRSQGERQAQSQSPLSAPAVMQELMSLSKGGQQTQPGFSSILPFLAAAQMGQMGPQRPMTGM